MAWCRNIYIYIYISVSYLKYDGLGLFFVHAYVYCRILLYNYIYTWNVYLSTFLHTFRPVCVFVSFPDSSKATQIFGQTNPPFVCSHVIGIPENIRIIGSEIFIHIRFLSISCIINILIHSSFKKNCFITLPITARSGNCFYLVLRIVTFLHVVLRAIVKSAKLGCYCLRFTIPRRC